MQSLIFDPHCVGIDSGDNGQNINGWTGWVTRDFDRFQWVFWHNPSCLVFIDEARAVFEDAGEDAVKLLTEGRHIQPHRGGGGGHAVYMLSQRYVGFDKTAREQATHGVIFRVGPDDARQLAEQFGADELRQASKLKALEYLTVDHEGTVSPGVLTF